MPFRINIKKTIISLGLSVILLLSVASNGIVPIYAKDTDYGLDNPKLFYNTRETVILGNYWQEDTNNDGIADKNDDKLPIVWQILEKYSDGTALVISDKILDEKEFNTNINQYYTNYNCTWESSSIRTWLNEDFYNSAFSINDKTAIITSDVDNSFYDKYYSDNGANTKDNIFLLSFDEAKEKYGFKEYVYDDQSRVAIISDYAKAQGVYSNTPDNSGAWWLRSHANRADEMMYVRSSGEINDYGDFVNSTDYFGIRPVMHINLKSEYVKQGESKNISLESTVWDCIKFGNYNGEDIEWLVLNTDGDDAFLLAINLLEKKEYNNTDSSSIWKDSSLRKWLNDDFYNIAFTDEEKKMIKTTKVLNNDNSFIGSIGGDDTIDKIFILSLTDIVNPSYGFANIYCIESESRVALFSNPEQPEQPWWIRSPGYTNYENNAVYVSNRGYVYSGGQRVNNCDYCYVRPALHIDLKSSAWTKEYSKHLVYGDISSLNPESVPLNPSSRTDIPIDSINTPIPTSYVLPTVSPTVTPVDITTTSPTSTPINIPTSSPIVVPTAIPTEENASEYGLSKPKIAFNYRETVSFGNYWQEDMNGDGEYDDSEKQPITWQVLEKYSDDTALVVSDKLLDSKQYNTEGVTDDEDYTDYSCTWETSTLRSWLNDNFYNNAFTNEEKKAIIKSEVTNKDNSKYDTDGGNDTNDYVFLLSIEDVLNSSLGFDNNSNTNDQSRTAKVTSYAKKDAIISSWDGTGEWWLRSPGDQSEGAAYVGESGLVYDSGDPVEDEDNYIRPALRINLKSSYVKFIDNTPVSTKGCEWDTVTFGKYDGKPIKWRVLNIDGDNAFLLSDSLIDNKPFNDEDKSITWKDSSIRSWLNEEFYNNSFTDNEKEMIKISRLINRDNPFYGKDGGDDTTDKVFLLSLDDINQPGYGFTNLYRVYSNTRIAKDYNDNEGFWWLRSPGAGTNGAADVTRNGVADLSGYFVYYSNRGVRPALYINLKSSAWIKGEKVIVGDSNGGKNFPLDSDRITSTAVDNPDEPSPSPVISPTAICTPTTIPTATVSPTATPAVIGTPTATPTEDSTASHTITPKTSPSSLLTSNPTAEPSNTFLPTSTPTSAVVKDKITTFSIKNKATIKKSAKIKIKDKDKIKKITLNGKTIKIKKNKTSFTLKLKSYKKKLKKKGKWNTLKVTDKKGNTKTIKFKTK